MNAGTAFVLRGRLFDVPRAEHDTRPGHGGVHKRTDAACGRVLSLLTKKTIIMLSTLIIVLLVLWLLGVVTAYTLGGLIHILLVVAIIVVLLRVIQGRNPIRG